MSSCAPGPNDRATSIRGEKEGEADGLDGRLLDLLETTTRTLRQVRAEQSQLAARLRVRAETPAILGAAAIVVRGVAWPLTRLAGLLAPEWMRPLFVAPGWPHHDERRDPGGPAVIFDESWSMLHELRRSADGEAGQPPPTSLIAVVGDETQAQRSSWMRAVARQDLRCAEVIIADAGETGDAGREIASFLGAGESPLVPVRVVSCRGDRSGALNAAAAAATGDFVALLAPTELPEADWLRRMREPMLADPQIQAVVGRLEVSHAANEWASIHRDFLLPPVERDSSCFLLGQGRPLMVRRAVVERLGGLADHVSPDIGRRLLELELSTLGLAWAYAPLAMARRVYPSSWAGYHEIAASEARQLATAHLDLDAQAERTGVLLASLALLIAAVGLAGAALLVPGAFAWAGIGALVALSLGACGLLLDKELLELWHQSPSLQVTRRRGRVIFTLRLRQLQLIQLRARMRGLHAARRALIGELLDVSKPTFVFMPGHEWFWMQQRPNHLATRLRALGFQVVYCPNNYREHHYGNFRRVAPDILLCKDPEALRPLRRAFLYAGAPLNVRQLGRFPRGHLIMDLVDDPEVSGSSMRDMRRMVARARTHVVTATRLLDTLKRYGVEPALLPNATIYEVFAPLATPRPVPADLAECRAARAGAPIVGYVGALAKWFDYDLVRTAAARRPHYLFVLIGPALDPDDREKLADLTTAPNVVWLGPKPFHQLPAYVENFGVATIPFLVNDITLATSPVKLFEYAAAEIPIVTTELPECRRIGPPVSVISGAEAFLDAIDRPLTSPPDNAEKRALRELALANTWQARATEIARLVGLIQPAAGESAATNARDGEN
jgi:glycosyltransferase involved in cell wall biosynthesis